MTNSKCKDINKYISFYIIGSSIKEKMQNTSFKNIIALVQRSLLIMIYSPSSKMLYMCILYIIDGRATLI